MTLALFSFFAGLLTIINPCVLPLAPVVMAGASARGFAAPLALTAGLVATFGLVGGALAAAGVELGDSPALRIIAAVLLIAGGVVLAAPAASDWLGGRLAPLADFGHRLAERASSRGPLGYAALGAALALVWAPCIGPTMGAALVMAGSSATRLQAVGNMMLFALGAAMALLAAGFGLQRLASPLRRAAMSGASGLKTAFGVVLVVIGVLAASGADKAVEGRLVAAMPDWLVTLATRF